MVALGNERTIEQDPAFAIRISVDVMRSRWDGDRGTRRGLLIPIRGSEDHLALGVTEIRAHGGSAIQVTRRMRAMLEELRDQVRPEHRAAVKQELGRLHAAVSQSFSSSVDIDRAGGADAQGIGGSTGSPERRVRSADEVKLPSRTE